MAEIPFDIWSFTDTYVEEYKEHLLGLDDSKARSQNVLSTISRVKALILYMGHGRPRLHEWLFFSNKPRIQA